MRIEKISSSPDRSGRYTVHFEDGTVMKLYRQTMEDFSLYAGMELNYEKRNALRSAAGQMSAKMRAVRIVSASSVSKRDLEQRLIHKGEDPAQAKEAVRWMSDLDLVDDRKTAEQIVDRCIRKGYGLAKAKQSLYEKRIPKDLWEEVLADYPDQLDSIIRFLEERLSEDSDRKEVKKAVDALLRRGHSYQTVRRGLDRVFLNTDDYLEE